MAVPAWFYKRLVWIVLAFSVVLCVYAVLSWWLMRPRTPPRQPMLQQTPSTTTTTPPSPNDGSLLRVSTSAFVPRQMPSNPRSFTVHMLHRARYMESLVTAPFRHPSDVLASLPDQPDAHFIVVKSLSFANNESLPRFIEAADSRYLLYAARRVDRNDYVVCCVTKGLLFSSVVARYNIESAYAPRLSVELLNANLRLVLPLNRISVSLSPGGEPSDPSDAYDRRQIAVDNLEQQVGSFEANRRNVLIGFTRSFLHERQAFVAACRERGVHRSRVVLQSLQANPPSRSPQAADKLLLLGNALADGVRQDGDPLDDNPEAPALFSLSATGPEKMLTLYATDTAIVRLL